MNKKNVEELTESFKAARYSIEGATLGEVIEGLALAFAGEGDFNGIFQLEQAAKRTAEIKSHQQRGDEFDAIVARIESLKKERDDSE